VQDIEPAMSHAAADVIFRTLFSIPIEDEIATEVYREFRAYQRSQPILNLRAFLPLPRWMPRGHRADLAGGAAHPGADHRADRRRVAEIAAGTAPDDLATKILTARDPETGDGAFGGGDGRPGRDLLSRGARDERQRAELDALPLARYPEWQERVAEEVAGCRRRRGRAISRGSPSRATCSARRCGSIRRCR
jgi:hypothetical protein